MNRGEETLERPGMQNGIKGPIHKKAAASQDREDKRGDRQEDHQAGNHKASSRDFQQDVENDRLDLVEGSAPSSRSYGPHCWGGGEKERENLWIIVIHLDLLAP
jgi:hypothetical protein